MTSLSDRNMSLGDVLLPQGGKQRCLCPWAQELFTLRKVILMQLYVALSLHFGRGSQLNTSEMFLIDISRWMISCRCRWISVYLPWRTAHALNLDQSCNIVSSHNPVNCPAVICLPRIAVLSYFGRDITSERHGAPVHVHIIGHFAIYFLLLLLSAFTFRSTIHPHYHLRFNPL